MQAKARRACVASTTASSVGAASSATTEMHLDSRAPIKWTPPDRASSSPLSVEAAQVSQQSSVAD